jgi:hypothetical protein
MDGAQMVMWTEGARHCVLWTVAGVPELRILDRGALIHSEPVRPSAGFRQARELRGIYGPAAADERDRPFLHPASEISC